MFKSNSTQHHIFLNILKIRNVEIAIPENLFALAAARLLHVTEHLRFRNLVLLSNIELALSENLVALARVLCSDIIRSCDLRDNIGRNRHFRDNDNAL